jgi:hypothetical protein
MKNHYKNEFKASAAMKAKPKWDDSDEEEA